MRIKIIVQFVFFLALIAFHAGCDNDSNAQQTNTKLDIAFSGSFVPASERTDSNEDDRPSSLRTYEGISIFGNSLITIIDEFAQPVPPVNCPMDNLEFDLVKGTFVIRVENGDLLFGQIESGFSCFDPISRTSEIFEEGIFTDGTGQFAGITGTFELRTSSIFQNTTAVNGFASGGSTGELEGTIEQQ